MCQITWVQISIASPRELIGGNGDGFRVTLSVQYYGKNGTAINLYGETSKGYL